MIKDLNCNGNLFLAATNCTKVTNGHYFDIIEQNASTTTHVTKLGIFSGYVQEVKQIARMQEQVVHVMDKVWDHFDY